MTEASYMKIRRSEERGRAGHGWLNTYFTFSFADYYDPKYNGFSSLRVINEDHIAGGGGFPMHPHANFEIFTYMISGALEHKDTMGNVEHCKRGQVQFTSAGSGIRHSEFNASPTIPAYLLQIWVKPHTMGLTPRYDMKDFPDEAKSNQLLQILSPDYDHVEGTIPISSKFNFYASILDDGKSVTHTVKRDKDFDRVYVHVPIVPGSEGLSITGTDAKTDVKTTIKLKPGDGAFIAGMKELTFTASGKAIADVQGDGNIIVGQEDLPTLRGAVEFVVAEME